MKKKLIIFPTMFVFLMSVVLMSSCVIEIESNEDNPSIDNPTIHEHSYSTAWSHDSNYHWHDATCEHNVTTAKIEHEFDKEIIIEPTETENGLLKYICRTCQYNKTEEIPKLTPSEPSETSFVIDTVMAKAGDTDVKVSIKVKNNPGVASIKLKIDFDAVNFTITNFMINSELGGTSVEFNSNVKTIYLNWVSTSEVTDEEFTFATLYFTVSNDTTTGNYKISATYDEDDVYNAMEENISFKVIDGEIVIK